MASNRKERGFGGGSRQFANRMLIERLIDGRSIDGRFAWLTGAGRMIGSWKDFMKERNVR